MHTLEIHFRIIQSNLGFIEKYLSPYSFTINGERERCSWYNFGICTELGTGKGNGIEIRKRDHVKRKELFNCVLIGPAAPSSDAPDTAGYASRKVEMEEF